MSPASRVTTIGRLAEKVAMVTGAGEWIVGAAALAFVAQGATVWAVDRYGRSQARTTTSW